MAAALRPLTGMDAKQQERDTMRCRPTPSGFNSACFLHELGFARPVVSRYDHAFIFNESPLICLIISREYNFIS